MVSLRWSVVVVLLLLFSTNLVCEVYATSLQATKWKRQDDELPPSPPWVRPEDIPASPECMSLSPSTGCPYQGTSTIDSCSAEKCSKVLYGACVEHAPLVDKSCFCTSELNENGCSACDGSKERAQYLTWLNSTCGDIEGWNGLSSDWMTSIPTNFTWVGNRTKSDDSWFVNACVDAWDVCTETFFPQYDPTSRSFDENCASFNTSLWEGNLYNATEALLAGGSADSYVPGYTEGYEPMYDPGLYLDLNGFCRSVYPSNNDTCGPGILHSELVLWASGFCNPPSLFGWPDDWKSSLLLFDSSFTKLSAWPSLVEIPGHNSCTSYIKETEKNCTSERCKGDTCENIVQAVSPSCFCKEMDLSSKCDQDEIESTSTHLFLNKTCATVNEFPGLPDGWEDALMVMNASYGAPKNFTKWPGCANAHSCGTTLNDTVTNCTQTLCDINPATGLCNSTILGVMPHCYCSPISFQQTCNLNCKLSWEREQYLKWMNKTCIVDQSWHGFPNNWTDLLKIQDSELLPWNWRIEIAKGSSSNTTIVPANSGHCPSVASKLGAFAAVNAAMALLTPILGRRDVLKKITGGCFGKRASSMWMLTGPLTATLHVASNAVAALLIQHTPGFENVDVGQLVLLWCTRPRLVWLIVILVPFGAADEIYFSVASSTLIAEICLQAVGAYYMGIATNYARRQKFYNAGRLSKTSKGKDAMIMYAGSVMWLSVIFIAVAVCIGSILGLSRFVAALASAIRGLDRKAIRHAHKVQARLEHLRASSWIFPYRSYRDSGLATKLRDLDDQWTESVNETEGNFTAIGEHWFRLRYYVVEDMNTMRKAEKADRLEKKRQKKAQKKRKDDSDFTQPQDSVDTTEAYAVWYQTPTEQLEKIEALHHAIQDRVTWVVDTQHGLDEDYANSLHLLQSSKTSLSMIEAKIACLDNASRYFNIWRAQMATKYGSNEAAASASEGNFLNLAVFRGGPKYHSEFSSLIRWKPSMQEVDLLKAFLLDGRPLNRQRTALIEPTNPTNALNASTHPGLRLIIRQLEARIECLDDLRVQFPDIRKDLDYLAVECTKLIKIWKEQKAKREVDKARKEEGDKARLRKIAFRTITGMFFCWIAQWVWWIGYVKVSDKSYCPPKLGKITVIWIAFSVLGAMVGGSL